MGVRDRIKNKLKQTLRRERVPAPSPPQQTAPSPPATSVPTKPKPQNEPIPAETLAPKTPEPPVQTKPKPQKKPVPDVSDAPKTVSNSPEKVPAPPAQKPQQAKPKKATVPRNHNDAPSRNAHLRPSFSTSESAFTVHVEHTETGLKESFPCEPDEFVLEAAERAGIELPFSCRSGGCLSCAGQLIEGETEMTEQFVLEESHIAEGFRLLCCTTVQSNASFIANQEHAID